MPFPTGWPPRVGSGQRTIRFYVEGTSTASFDDNAFLFVDGVGANPYTPTPIVPPGGGTVPGVPSTNLGPSPLGTGASSDGSSYPMIWSRTIRIVATGTFPIEFSFDGTNVHGSVFAVVAPGMERIMDRQEAGIAVRGVGGTPSFIVEAW